MKNNGIPPSPGIWPRERFTEPPASTAPPSKGVLFYSTDTVQQRLLVLMLARGGYEVQAESHVDAVLNRARSLTPAAVLLDASPSCQVAYDLLQRLRLDPVLTGIPALVLSTQMDTSLMELAFDLGADDYILKPLHLDSLLLRLRVAVKKHQRVVELQRQLAYLQEQNHYLYHTFAPSSLEEQRHEARAR